MTKSDDVPAGESTEVLALRVDLETYFSFLRDIGTETRDPVLSRMAGYAYGYATAKLEDGDPASAAKQLAWLVNESTRYREAIGYPDAPRSR
ncbi:hypothetical protein [Streptomyces sp. IBSBF 2950]|uniref:hypothetical protein n=1 Tax=Streptomyces sp. IBSBF 2950 TaxID=2903528 RepID=UPI002FDBE186